MRRRTRYLLTASLVLNGLLAGFIIGDLSRPIEAAQALSEFNQPYPDEIRRDLRQGFMQNRAAIRGDLQALSQARRDLLRVMADPAASREDIAARMAAIRSKTSALQERFQGITLDVVETAPPDLRGQIRVPTSGRGQRLFDRTLGR